MIATLKWSPDAALFLLENVTLDRITDHRWLDQTVQKLIAFRSRKFIACPSNPSVLNNASVLWCAKKSRMRVLMDSCHRNIWIEFLFRRDFTEGSHSRLALLHWHTNFAFVVYIFVNFFSADNKLFLFQWPISLKALSVWRCIREGSGYEGFSSGRAACTLVHRTL